MAATDQLMEHNVAYAGRFEYAGLAAAPASEVDTGRVALA